MGTTATSCLWRLPGLHGVWVVDIFGRYDSFNLYTQMWEVARTRLGRVADVFCIFLMVVYNFVAHAAVVTAIVNFNLPPVPALVLSVEQVVSLTLSCPQPLH